MESIIISLAIIFFGIMIAPEISKRTKMPLIVIEIILGAFFGASLLNVVSEDPIIDFFKSFGLIYLMFLAGLDVDFSKIEDRLKKTIKISLFSILIPFITGILISPYIGIHPLFAGTVFSTTSIGIILPFSKEVGKKEEFSETLISSVVLVDILSIFLLAFTITFIQGALTLSFLYSAILLTILFLIPYGIKKRDVRNKIESWLCDETHFEQGVRLSFALIISLVALSGELGFHSIMGAFIAGLIISELTPQERSILERKLESFGYGFFIPLFFILVGARMNIPLLLSSMESIEILLIVVISGIISKVAGVSFISNFSGFNIKESLSMGLLHATRLSLIIAAVEIGYEIKLINDELFSIFVILAIISVIICPSLVKRLLLISER